MKLIIDIDKELYMNVKEYTRNGYHGSDVWKAVATGTPYFEEIQNCNDCSDCPYCPKS